jgi:hypothetical protein
VARVVVITAAQQRRTMRGSTQFLGRIASGGRWRADAAWALGAQSSRG